LNRLRLALVLAGILCYAQQSFAQFTGGDNDGYGTNVGCIQSLNGTSGLVPSAITGSTQFCAFATEAYSITISGATPSTIYTWTAPPGATITSGQGTTSVLITFGNTNGNVSVDVSNECTLVNVSLPVTLSSCAFFGGGDNDGFASNIGCIQTLNGGAALIPGPIVGSTGFCPFATEAYSITVSGATASSIYTWSVPPGATITAGQGTTSILVTFGGTDGNISVDISNECETVNQTLAVTASSCTFFAGGSNDGFTSNIGCIQNLNGGSAFIQGPIVGSVQFCAFATEAYSIVVAGATSSTIYTWSGPPGSTITAGQGTNSVLITFGGTDGNISVDVSNECETVNQVLAVTSTSCTFFAGGSNDGFTTNVGCIQNLNGGSAFIPGPIIGSTEFCPFATEIYTINVAGATLSTIYTWSGPAGSTITSGQGTNSVVITFGGVNGNVSVAINNECETVNQVLPVTTSSCAFFAGGNNDGFTTNVGCIQNLDGGSAFTPGPIVGSTDFCSFASEAYTITVAGATASTIYTWSGPAGSTITSGQGTNIVLISFGSTSGVVSVNISNECETRNVTLGVSLSSCLFYHGGSNDGFSVTTTVNIPLPVELVSFDARVEDNTVQLNWITASEVNNNFFEVEKSKDGTDFFAIEKIPGSGTTNQRNTYYAVDESPFSGVSYYRLTQTDFDGTKSYSKIITVHVHGGIAEPLKMYPNPIHNGDVLHFEYYAELEETVKISVVDAFGKMLETHSVKLKTGSNTISLTPDFKAHGVYVIHLQTKTGKKAIKLLVQ
jgi:hypothetical protein